LLEKRDNLGISMSHLLYGADVSRNDQRSLGNVKPGDLAMMWVPETKSLYGVFEIQDRIFYDEKDLGWTKSWPYRCRLELWDGYLRTIPDEHKAKLMSFVSRELVTLNDLTNLGGYIHSLLYDEGMKLLSFFLANSEMKTPLSVFPDFGTKTAQPKTPVDFASRISSEMPEYILEMYLLQNPSKLEEIVGKGISETYNMLFGYQNRYLDLMTVHEDENGNSFKTTVIELKAGRFDEKDLERALDELSSYIFWISDQMKKGKLNGSPDSIYGMLVLPHIDDSLKKLFIERARFYGGQYGIPPNRVHCASLNLQGKELHFRFEI
jgi:hypothetical protein